MLASTPAAELSEQTLIIMKEEPRARHLSPRQPSDVPNAPGSDLFPLPKLSPAQAILV